jgi:predicted nucleotidyltransferase
VQNVTTDSWLATLEARNLLPEDALAAYVVGSTARGWDNARSDFDIYVVISADELPSTPNSIPLPLDPPFVRSEVFFESGKRWEVTYWLDSQIDQMLSKVSWEVYEAGIIAQNALVKKEEEALARLGNCLPLVGKEWLDQARTKLKESAFRSFAVVRSLVMADDAVEDALGQMEAGDLCSATMSARIAFGHSIDALLDGEGEYGSPMPKWRPNRFKAASPPALSFEDYWEIETMQEFDPADPRPWITKVLTICQDIAMRVETS